MSDDEVMRLDKMEFDRVHSCQAKAQVPAAFRPKLPVPPVIRPDGTWLPGDVDHLLGPGRRWFFHPAPS